MTSNWTHQLDLESFEVTAAELDKALFHSDAIDIKVDDSKLAKDVDDLTDVLQGLDDGHSLPFDLPEEDSKLDSSWINDLILDDPVLEDASTSSDEEMEEEYLTSLPEGAVHAAPFWAHPAPLDPRSCIQKPVFSGLDARIPRIGQLPRLDLGFASPSVSNPPTLSPKPKEQYKHDPATCWICKSDKSAFKKRALHRYHEKRSRRNWKRGPRYSGRSNVATSRVRNGGRFVCKTQWI